MKTTKIIPFIVLLILTTCSIQMIAQTFPPNLISWWRGESNILDSFGANNGAVDVPLVSLSYAPGQYGQAFEFSGGYVKIPDAADLKPITNLTLQAWVRSTGPGLWKYIVSKSQSAGGSARSSYGFYAGSNNGNLIFYVYDGTNRFEAPASPAGVPWDGNWHIATGTYDGTTVRLYLDGGEVGSGTATTNNIDYSNAAPLVFGNSATNATDSYSGDLDEVKLFNLAMSPNDVINTYLDPNDPAGTNGLVGWWRGENNANDSWGTHNGTDGVTPAKPFYFVTGRAGQAMFLPNNPAIAMIPDDPSLKPANLTLNLWVRSITPGTYKYVVAKSQTTSTASSSYAMYTGSGGGLYFLIYNGAAFKTSPQKAAASIWDGRWHMATGTYDGSMVRLYVDGVQVGTGTADSVGIDYSLAQALVIGDYRKGGGANFTGGIDEMQLYDRALSDSEILNLYISYSSGPVSWWQAADNANDTLGGNNGVMAGSAGYGSDRIGSGSAFKTRNGSVQIPNSLNLQPTNVAVEAWVRCLSPGNNKYILSKSSSPTSASYALSTGPGGGLQFSVSVGSGVVNSPAAGAGIWDGFYHLVDGIYDGQKVRLFVDKVEIGSGNAATGPIVYGTSQSAGMLIFGDFSDVPAGANFPGYIDEVKVYDNIALALQSMAADFDMNSAPVMIYNQPASQTLNPGSTLTLSVTAKSTAALAYQWTRYGTNLAGATTSTLTVNNVQPANAGPYACVVSTPGLTYAAGTNGQAFNIGGSGGSLRVPNDPAFATDNFTVQLWAQNTGTMATWKHLFCKTRDALAYNASYDLYTDGSKNLIWAVALTNSTASPYFVTYASVSAGTTLWNGQWNQLTATWDGQTSSLYTNGVLCASVNMGAPTNIFYKNDFNDGDLIIGDYAGGGGARFPGLLDEVKYYNHAMTPTEVASSFSSFAFSSGLIGSWLGEDNFLDLTGPNYGYPIPPAGSVISGNATVTVPSAVIGNYRLQSGLFRGDLSGPAGMKFIVQKSADLVTWVPLATNTVPFTFSDPAVPGGTRFYRAVLSP